MLQAQHAGQQAFTLDEVSRLSQVDVHQFYGIEIEEWPARIAEVALWLMDHQSNLRILEAFSQPYQRLPLKQTPHIRIDNALRMDWNDLLPASECSYVLGNPPFVGKSLMSGEQKSDMRHVLQECKELKGGGVLDYVTAWYLKAAKYIDGTPLEVAFVSTNSISQGEQPGILWSYLFGQYGININFAYQTFVWDSEARGKAHVHVVIIGFSQVEGQVRTIFSLTSADEPHFAPSQVARISPYLVEGGNLALTKRTSPICDVARMQYGSKPVDGSHLLLDSSEKVDLLRTEPSLEKYIRPFVGGEEFLWGLQRWCLWLLDAVPSDLRASAVLTAKLRAIKNYRAASRKEPTREAAMFPSRFAEVRQPATPYLAIPEVSSERRRYIPMAFLSDEVIASNKIQMIPSATIFTFGLLTSDMHMSWSKQVCGRLKSDLNYSSQLVYNNYPWPEAPTDAQRAAVEREAQAVLNARALYPDSTLATLYDPLLMPPELVKAHGRLDRAVERCYRPEPFASDRERVEFLFALYEKLTAPLLPAPATPKRRRSTRK